jgi:glycosyltransferase involved in cell wall biosynthesis
MSDFTVVIPSRNRPVPLDIAVRSVLEQTHASVEVVVVNDGSNREHADAYTAIAARPRVRMINLRPTADGHGPSFAINRGAEAATGRYVCLLDDNDYWTDPEHLARAWQHLSANEGSAEVYFSNQVAYMNDKPLPARIWLEPVADILRKRGATAKDGVFAPTLQDLMQCGNFCHFNTTIVSRDLYWRCGGMDEFIRYENDRDYYLRVIDQANGILFYPGGVSRHNVPDPALTVNASTVVTYQQKMLFRNYLWNKARLFAASPLIRQQARINVGFTMRRIAEALAGEPGRALEAFRFARQALGAHFTVKWMAYCAWLGLRALFRRRSPGA